MPANLQGIDNAHDETTKENYFCKVTEALFFNSKLLTY